jgi:hypothetical protein
VITKALLIAIAALIAIAHPQFVAPMFGLLALGVAHLAVVALVLELATAAGLACLIAEVLARGRAPRRPALS